MEVRTLRANHTNYIFLVNCNIKFKQFLFVPLTDWTQSVNLMHVLVITILMLQTC